MCRRGPPKGNQPGVSGAELAHGAVQLDHAQPQLDQSPFDQFGEVFVLWMERGSGDEVWVASDLRSAPLIEFSSHACPVGVGEDPRAVEPRREHGVSHGGEERVRRQPAVAVQRVADSLCKAVGEGMDVRVNADGARRGFGCDLGAPRFGFAPPGRVVCGQTLWAAAGLTQAKRLSDGQPFRVLRLLATAQGMSW